MIVSNPADARHGRGIQDYLDILRRQKWVFGLCLAGAAAVGFLLYLHAPRRYEAEAAVALDVRKLQVLPTDTVVAPLPQESPVLRTELDVIGSRLMAGRVLDALADGAAQASPEDRRKQIDQLLQGLKISNDGRSYTMFLSYSAADPMVAARTANAYAEAYLDYQTSVQTNATRQAAEWLGRKVAELRRQVEAAEMTVETFRRTAGIVVSDGASLETQRVDSLNTELVAARTQRSEAQARLQTAQELSQSPNGLDAFSAVLNSPIIQSLRGEQAKTERSLSELQDTGATQSEKIPALQSQLASLKAQITDEVSRITTSLQNEIDVAKRKEDALQAQFDAAVADLSTVNQSRVRLNQLVREADANRTIYESYLARYKQMIEQDGLATPEALLISRAEAPAKPASPNLIAFLGLSILAGCGLGFGAMMIRESGDTRIRSVRALKDAVPVPVIGTLPQVSRRGKLTFAALLSDARQLAGRLRRLVDQARGLPSEGQPPSQAPTLGPGPAELVAKAPHAPFSEAMRKLRSTLLMSPATRSARVLMVTSATMGEGKTTVAIALARSIALSGHTVVVVDADLRNPALASHAAVPSKTSMMDILAQDGAFDEAITVDVTSPVHLIAAARPAADGTELMPSRQSFKTLLAALRKRYEFVILDTGPVLQAAEATQIGDLVDATLFVVGWGQTTVETVTSAVEQLALCGLSISGMVLNQMVGYRHAQYTARALGITPGGRGDGPAPRPRLVHRQSQ